MNTNRITELARLHSMQIGVATLSLVTLLGGTGTFTAPLSGSVTTEHAAAEHQAAPLNTDSVGNLREAMRMQRKLSTHSVTIRFTTGTGTVLNQTTIALADHPEWITLDRDMTSRVHASVRQESIEAYLDTLSMDSLQKPSACSILREYIDPQGVTRIETSCTAETGYRYNASEVATIAKHALETNNSGVSIAVSAVTPTIEALTSSGLTVKGTLTLLASGQSDFKGSGEGRKWNVRKAINEQVNNIVIPEGAEFSFNSALGGRVDLSTGWKLALTIFNGKDLKMFPGGGICQASTTLYRAVLRAGFPILKQKNHSLYVTYYEKHGVGLDATIFPGQQDLTFVNDTPGPIVIQSYSRGDEAFVNIFGIDDHRSVTMTGPYFTATAPEDLLANGHTLRRNEIAWQRSVRLESGERSDEVFAARYNAIPKSLAKRSPLTTERTRGEAEIAMHAPIAQVSD